MNMSAALKARRYEGVDVAKRSKGTGERFTVVSEAVMTIPTRIQTKMDPTIKLIKLGMAKQAISGKGKRFLPSHHQGVKSNLKLHLLETELKYMNKVTQQ